MNFKKLFFLGAILLFTTVGNTQETINAIDQYFQQYVEDERFSVVYISPRLFQLIESIGGEKLELDDSEADAFMDMASDLRGLRILSTSTTPMNFFNEFKSTIDAKVYEPLMTVREKDGGKLEFYLRENKDKVIEELLFFSYGKEDFTFMSFVGPIKLDKVMRLADELENE